MTKRKGVISKVFVVLVVLTLLSCCFLGSTFARYTSGGSGTATMQVAKWDVNQTEADMDVTFDALSPSKAEWTGAARTHTSAVVKIAAITNNGEVNADVTFAVDDTVTVALDPSTTWGWGTSFACDSTTGAVTGAPSQDEVAGLFSITLYATETANNYTADEEDKVTFDESDEDKTTLVPGQSIYLWATVTWTSDDDLNSTTTGVEPDALDTWVGENVESVAWTVSFKAVQSSTLPSTLP